MSVQVNYQVLLLPVTGNFSITTKAINQSKSTHLKTDQCPSGMETKNSSMETDTLMSVL